MYKDFPTEYYALLNGDNIVLLETSRYDAENHLSLLFADPLHVLRTDSIDEVGALLQAIQHYTEQGYYVAGYVGYECGSYFERIETWEQSLLSSPLAWFGVYAAPLIFNHATGQTEHLPTTIADLLGATPSFASMSYTVRNVHFDLPLPQYQEKFAQLKRYIRNGDTYQVNLTGRYHFDFQGSPLALYTALKGKQQVSFGAYLRAAGQDILCFSPELFFRIADTRITAKPMKGTAPRGSTVAEDFQWMRWLRTHEKNRAENIMIVDLLRNDLGRLCNVGSVHVPQLCVVEQYATLHQMTSTIEGSIGEKLNYTNLFRSLFPCGSVTGAPKVRSMQIIRELETSPRGIYTGAIGYIAPASAAHLKQYGLAQVVFNVAIRTIVLRGEQGTMGIGGGIVYDSMMEEEYAECALKAKFLTSSAPEFALLETILWDGGYRRLEQHLGRMAHSAAYFAYPFDRAYVITVLQQQSLRLVAGCTYKVRLMVDRQGAVTCEQLLLEEETSKSARILVSPLRTQSSNVFLYHKTTQRALYDEAYRQARQQGYADIIFLNERGEVTEGAVSNIFIQKDDRFLTPPLHCGLLNGIMRQSLLKELPNAYEEVVSLEDLLQADGIFICNAIRGLRQVVL